MLNKNSIKNHIKSNDFFSTTATVLNLTIQKEGKPELKKGLIEEIIEELLFIEKNYKLVKR